MINISYYATINLVKNGLDTRIEVFRRGEAKPFVKGIYGQDMSSEFRIVWDMIESFIPIGKYVRVNLLETPSVTWQRSKDGDVGMDLHFRCITS